MAKYDITNLVLYITRSAGAGALYLDSIILRERADTYYLIRDSWRTPNSCIIQDGLSNQFTVNTEDADGNIIAGKYVGCYEYKDTDNQSNYLYKFTDICEESAAGCELMIDTQNYTPFSGTPNPALVPGNTSLTDAFTYMVYDPAKRCDKEVKGCQALGAPRAGRFYTLYF